MEIIYKPSGNNTNLSINEVAEAVSFAGAVKIRRAAPEGSSYMYDMIDVLSVTRVGDVVILEIG